MSTHNNDPRILIALNERKLNNNHLTSNQMLHHLQLQTKILDSNKLRKYITHNGTKIMQQNTLNLEEYKMTFHPKRRPDEKTISTCDKYNCGVSILTPNGYGQKRTHNI